MITVEAFVVLGLVTYYQNRINMTTFLLLGIYLTITTWALFSQSNVFPYGPTDEMIADGDPLILLNYGVALLLNLSVLFQIVYFGTQKEGKSLVTLLLADVKSEETVGEG